MQRCFIVITFAFIFSSCSLKSESDLAIFRSIQVSLVQSTNVIAVSNKQICLAIEQRVQNPRTGVYAKQWQTKALLIKYLSDNTINYIDSLIMELKNEAGLKMENSRETFREDDKDAVERLFITNNKAKELQARLMQYRAGVLAVDAELFKQFEHITIDVSDSLFKKGFTKTYFHDIPTIAALAELKKYKNEVVNTENQFLSVCLNRTSPAEIIDDFPHFLVSQSSNYVKEGDIIVITAGVGIFSTELKTAITIGNKLIKGSDEGFVTYKFKAKGNVGKNKIPLKLEFLKPDGTKVTVARKIEYSIIE